MNSTVKTILFWMAMIVLAVLLWRMASTGSQTARDQTPSYTDFQAQVQKGNVSEATIMLSPVSAEVDGEFREPKTKFRVTVPKETLSDLTKELQAKNVEVNIKEVRNNDWVSFLIDGVPFLLLLVVFLIM
ncbi:MAG: ATP-dependent metallopeptidase FtsH/Yme1/Tma family protein, partial [Candidatus Acidiferrales bacterium]